MRQGFRDLAFAPLRRPVIELEPDRSSDGERLSWLRATIVVSGLALFRRRQGDVRGPARLRLEQRAGRR